MTDNPADEAIAAILNSARTIAMVGASPDPLRPSHGVMRYLQAHGFRVIPVNPTLVGRDVLGEPAVADLSEIEGPVDIVDIFRRPEAVLDAVHSAIREKDQLGIKAVWLQLGVVNGEAASQARAAGLAVVMDRCIKIDHARLVA
jgi:predicted CoA-binding protein